MIEGKQVGEASALAAAIEKLRKVLKGRRTRLVSYEVGYNKALSDVLALLAGVSAERSENTK